MLYDYITFCLSNHQLTFELLPFFSLLWIMLLWTFTYIQVFMWTYVFSSFECIPRCGIARSHSNSVFNFLRNCQTVFHSSCTILHFHQQCMRAPIVYSFLIFKFILFIYFWLHWVFIAARGLSLVGTSGGYSSLWYLGFSSWWLLLLRSKGSRPTGSVVVARGL